VVLQFRRLLPVIIGFALLCDSGNVFAAPAQSSAPKASKRSHESGTSKKSKSRKAKVTSKKKRSSPRLRRMRKAFVASKDLKPMAQQLLQDRTPAGYAGVEAYARRHAADDAGSLAWLVVGYAHVLDRDYAKAVDPLKRAQSHSGEIGDYVDYYLGNAYFQTGRTADAATTFGGFEKDYPNSLLIRDADVLNANALLAQSKADQAIEVLEKHREPTRSDLELALGRAYQAKGQTEKATAIFRNIYFTMPLSGEAVQAGAELSKVTQQGPAGTPKERRSRADLLMRGRRYKDAADEYRNLVDVVSADDKPGLQLDLVAALRRSGQNKEAKTVLDSVPETTPDISAERLFNMAELARASDNDDEFLSLLGQLRQRFPTSAWLEQALLSAGNIYLLRKDYDHAIDNYRELQQRFPSGGRSAYAHWKAAWLSLRLGRTAEAKQEFEQQIALYPSSAEVPAALYWRGRLAEEDGDQAMARAYYQKVSDRFRNYYYGELARQQLKDLKVTTVADTHYALLDRVPPIGNTGTISEEEVPDDDLRVQKAHLLENGALLDFAVRELRAAADEEKGNWAPAEIARMYQDAGRYDMAIEVLKRAVPNYFAVDLPTLPRAYWEALFPRPYWSDLKQFSSSNSLDPYLVASLIRQESEFNPSAVSRADAIGLMQLLPKVGKGVAKQEKIPHFNTTQLFTPAVNLRLGTRYFRSMVDKFGAFEYALAAYNAGSDRVQDWLSNGKYRDPQEFVESIPFTETREYVQAILRNAYVYRQLYGTP
jgi:soluble lytic murein transglycosylase